MIQHSSSLDGGNCGVPLLVRKGTPVSIHIYGNTTGTKEGETVTSILSLGEEDLEVRSLFFRGKWYIDDVEFLSPVNMEFELEVNEESLESDVKKEKRESSASIWARRR